MTLLTLPHELVERILLLLPTESVQTCRLVNSALNQVIQSSALLQYFQACEAAGVVDNPRSPLSYAERLEALEMREEAWRKLKPVFEMTIIDSVNPQTAHIYRSTEGVYFFPDDNLRAMNYCHLTSFPQDNPQWIKIPGHGPALDWSGILVGFAAALYEHDLIVHSISSEIESQADMQLYSLDLVLLKFSTGDYHPLARRPRIHVQRSPEDEPWVVSRIAGDNLAMCIYSADPTFPDRLFIFDWKTGRKLIQHDTNDNNTYLDLIFISPELLLVPNRVLSHFEVWHLPNQLDPKPPIQILSLKIPAFSPGFSHHNFRCYGEPNPFLRSMPYFPSRPFFSSPESSIIMVPLRMTLISGRYQRHASYNLIMHRRALLDTIQTWTSLPLLEQQEYAPMWLTNEVTVHQIADPEDGSVHLDARSELVLTMLHLRSSPRTPTFPTSHIPAESGSSPVSSGLSSNPSISQCTFPQVPWAKWGPPISRWFQVNETQARWIAVCNGQRYAFSEPNPLDKRKLIVSVADFNPYNVRRNAEMMARLRNGEGENNGRNNNNGNEEKEFEILDHKGAFSEEVYMGLKCVVYRAPDEYDFDAVLVDEQRLLGLKLGRGGWEKSIKALYIG